MRKLWVALALSLVISAGSALTPAVADAGSGTFKARNTITIVKNTEFDEAHGVVAGTGSKSDPYVIAGWDVPRIQIKDTSKHVIIRDNKIGTLILDWIGGGAHVFNNQVVDMRVNQNVPRTGDMTSGVIANNTFERVGQLRHWDGVFENNKVGGPDSCGFEIPFMSCRAVNFDGFNGSKFRNNTIYGYVEVRLHGHHHSSDFSEHSHYHGKDHMDMADHTKRFHQVWVKNNTIHSGDYYGLLYTDSNHAGNDRTATSETNEDLNLPHVHTTKVHLMGNKIYGSGIDVNIFNADDSRHTATNTGLMNISNNEIYIQPEKADIEDSMTSRDGIAVSQANDVKLRITDNFVDGSMGEGDALTGVRKEFDYGSGIYLWDLRKASVLIKNNEVRYRTYGVSASQMGADVEWWVEGLKTRGVQEDVHYDSSVENKPRRKA